MKGRMLLSAAGVFFSGLLYCYTTGGPAQGADGDLAPWGAPDGQLNAADLLIMQRIVLGDITPTALDLLHDDLYPAGAPDGVIDLSDLILQFQKITLQNGTPVAADDPNAATTPENTAVTTVNVLANDTLVDNAVISAFDNPSVNGGTVLNNGDGTFTYTQATNFNGTDSFTYTLTDAGGDFDTAVVTVEVTAVNDSPVALGIADQTAPQELPFSFKVPGSAFSDPDGDSLNYTATLADDSPLPAWLTFTIDTFSGIPSSSNAGVIDIKLTADDGNGGTVFTTFTLSVPDSIRFAIIADYGTAGAPLAAVASLVKSWNPDFITTAGDNNYPDGEAATIDANIGQYYQEFIGNYTGTFGPGSAVNRFLPALGNHDWATQIGGLPQPYLDYFNLPGNERYYSFAWGNIEFFMLDSDPKEPDGRAFDSVQGQWLQSALATSTAKWQFVYMHHPPYSSGALHGSETVMQWPYEAWGADAVIAGHDHIYERLAIGGIPYIVNGLGGFVIHDIGTAIPGSQISYNANYGAMLVTANAASASFDFYSTDGTLIDSYVIDGNPNRAPVAENDAFIIDRNTVNNIFDVIADNGNGADNDPEGNALIVTKAGIPDQGGTVAINITGDGLVYTPLTNYVGNETFTYTVSDGVLISTATVVVTIRDTTSPIISNIQVISVTGTEATITWQTDEPANSSVSYGLTSAYENGTLTDNSLATAHSITLTGLTPGVQYRYQISSLDGGGNTASIGWRHLSSKNGDIPVPGVPDRQVAALILDIDNDGINDFVIAANDQAPSVEWYRHVSGGWVRYVIDDTLLPLEAGGASHDIDGDGDLDVVFGDGITGNSIYWWENPFPNYEPNTPWVRRLIKNAGATKHHDMLFGDFDADGLIELVYWNQGANQLAIADIPTDPRATQPWPSTAIFTGASAAEGLARADIDGDGQTDIIGGGRWFKHNGGTSYTENIIDDSQRFGRVATGQLKPGGRPEVVFVVGDGIGPLKWYEWVGGVWVGQDLLGFDVDHGHSLAVADMNDDGKLDIFCAEMNLNNGNPDAMVWIFYGDGQGNFTTTVVSTGIANHESRVGDLDGDGDLDILGKPWRWDTPRLDIWLNPQKPSMLTLDSWERQVVDATKPWRSIFITSSDLDGDTRKDIITGGWWYRNPGSPAGAWARNSFGSPLNNIAAVADFDGDGDKDVLGTQGQGSNANPDFVWARNDASGVFTILANVPSGDGDFLQGVAVDRFKSSGELEVALSWHNATAVQMLTLPANPSTDPWMWRAISQASQAEALSSGDIDRDGDRDLLLGTQWLRNDGAVWTLQTLDASTTPPDRNRLADINSDGRLDAVVGFEAISKPGKLAWYEQGASAEATWTERLIATIVGPMSLDVADMDGDGDLDVVAGEHNLADPANANLYVFENVDGQGLTWSPHLVYTGDEHHDGAQLVDIDSDGDLDILSIGWGHNRVLLYENNALDADRVFITPGDITPPVISNVQAAVTESEATVTWGTDELADSTVSYGPTTAYENGVVTDAALVTTHSITLTGLTSETLYHYQVSSVDLSANSASSVDLTFTTASDTAPPTVSTPPADQIISAGSSATFSVVASGAAPLSYQWQRDGVDIPGATLETYTTPATSPADNGATFRVTVSNAFGTVTSATAVLTVTTATRVTGSLALYTFEEGSGTTVQDVSGAGVPLDLAIENPAATSWLSGGLAINTPTLIASAGAATKLIDAMQATNALTIEAWLIPANTTQDGPARIVTLSLNTAARNFALGQGLWGSQPSDLYDVRLRTTATSDNGRPSLSTLTGTLTTTLTHVVYTRDASGLARLYLDGMEQASATVGGDLSNWAIDHRLALANEPTGDRPWLGELHLIAIYDRALTPAEVGQNFNAGP